MHWGNTAELEALLLLRVVAAGAFAAVVGWERETAGIGIAAGFGRFVLAAGATILLALVLHLLPRIERR